MKIVGVDLSGPSNLADTGLVSFRVGNKGLDLEDVVVEASDGAILDLVTSISRETRVVVGLDAPLSYNPGGGDRAGDANLRRVAIASGLHPGSVMPPTMNRMVYLTLRGISVARLIHSVGSDPPEVIEVHPGATMLLRGAPLADVRHLKSDPSARQRLLTWLEDQGLGGVAAGENPSDHYVAACAAGLAAWKWSCDQTVWKESAMPPWHPFDYAC